MPKGLTAKEIRKAIESGEIDPRQVRKAINERVCNARYRKAIRLYIFDDVTQERLAEILSMSPRQIWTIIKETGKIIDNQL